MGKLPHRTEISVKSEVTEKSGGHSPENALVAFLGHFGNDILLGTLGVLSVHHFMVACKDVPSSDVLKGGTCLEKEASLRDLDSDLFPVSEPDIQSRIAGFPMDCKEGNIIVESGKGCANVMADEVRPSGGKKVSSSFHSLGKCVRGKTHTNSGHLSSNLPRIEESSTPVVHLVFPIRESLRGRVYLWEIVISLRRSGADFPHISPLHVHCGREGRHRLIFSRKMFDLLVMIASTFNLFWGDPCLIVEFGFGIRKFFTVVELI